VEDLKDVSVNYKPVINDIKEVFECPKQHGSFKQLKTGHPY
jgi:hypothetical protein